MGKNCTKVGGGGVAGREGGVCPGVTGPFCPTAVLLGLGGEDVHFWGWVGRGDLPRSGLEALGSSDSH